uniref:SH3 domain-containing protein n=1 Tax=Amphimedon queenslandica TaxID=400682 RepID=A0A1X7T119_AMPQE
MKLTVGYCTIWKKQKIQEERVARLEEKETEGAAPQSVINQGNKPTAENVFIAHYDYHATTNSQISFSEGEQLEIYEKESSYWWKGRSLVSGDEGVIPSSFVYSMLESLQLLRVYTVSGRSVPSYSTEDKE